MASPRVYWALLALGIFPFYVNGYINSQIASRPVAYWTFELFYWVALPLFVFVVLVRFGGLRLANIGLHGMVRGRRSIGLVIFIAVLLCPIDNFVYGSSLSYFKTVWPDSGLFSYEAVLPAPGTARTLMAIYFALTAGIVEELYFRGLAFRACAMLRYPLPLYLIISPLLFASIHWETGAANTAATYVLGVFSAAAFLALRNLWPLIVAHAYTDYVWFS